MRNLFDKLYKESADSFYKKLKENLEKDKKMFIDYLRSEGEVFISVSKNPVTIKEDGTKIFKCEIEKKDIKYICEITEKFHNWCIESEIFIKE